MKHAFAEADRRWSNGSTTAWCKRNRKAPLFVVGYTTAHAMAAGLIVTHHVAGTSNVDWESAFANAEGRQ